MYIALAFLFLATIATGLGLIASFVFKSRLRFRFAKAYGLWLVFHILFILFGTGPESTRAYRSASASPYKLPWRAGITRFVSQGNRSFTSHRGLHHYAWDFWMSLGSDVLAARAGIVTRLEQSYDGIGLHSNFVTIEHEDGTHALYAHIRKDGAVVKIGDRVEQGQLIAYSGMVGQTINPHLHFVVLNHEETESLPILFSDVEGGLPLAGHSYTSGNPYFIQR